MSDSVDRVFSHALNTVNKIRTGSQKPPSATRLRLYGLYKQAMEGDVEGIMQRPTGTDEASQRAREKWDAWHQQSPLSRTEAKRRYITTLISTMHAYASPSPDSRELVAELEFVWDQVKSNVPSSSSSSPQHIQSGYSQHDLGQSGRAAMDNDKYDTRDGGNVDKQGKSQSEEELEEEEEEGEEEAEMDREIFVDAPDSQYNPDHPNLDTDNNLKDTAAQTNPHNLLSHTEPIPIQTPTPAPRTRPRRILGPPISMPNFISTPAAAAAAAKKGDQGKESAEAQKWRKRVEQALIRMTAEVAALREQLEARRLFSHSAHYVLFRGVWRWAWAVVKHVAVDVFLLGILLLYMRRKEDRRLEGAIRVVLGDAIAQVQRGGGAVLERVRLPMLGWGKKKNL
ncbi:hypothetical protein EJ02DRAFT_446870 [Clathrospora elynae]|uniref:ACB domain-containing protein n=1 Tax=Clathrospora elynae TaxID=706981 RepID=A0A6A5SET1_9PLEO|nr:hypothetical protein EJ02DRAFT_446870 [Clathrospora elynae]